MYRYKSLEITVVEKKIREGAEARNYCPLYLVSRKSPEVDFIKMHTCNIAVITYSK